MTHYLFFSWFIWNMAIFSAVLFFLHLFLVFHLHFYFHFLLLCKFSKFDWWKMDCKCASVFSLPQNALFSSSFLSHLSYTEYCEIIFSCEWTQNHPFYTKKGQFKHSLRRLLSSFCNLPYFSINQWNISITCMYFCLQRTSHIVFCATCSYFPELLGRGALQFNLSSRR